MFSMEYCDYCLATLTAGRVLFSVVTVRLFARLLISGCYEACGVDRQVARRLCLIILVSIGPQSRSLG